jgi:hypothetical protein
MIADSKDYDIISFWQKKREAKEELILHGCYKTGN